MSCALRDRHQDSLSIPPTDNMLADVQAPRAKQGTHGMRGYWKEAGAQDKQDGKRVMGCGPHSHQGILRGYAALKDGGHVVWGQSLDRKEGQGKEGGV